MKRKFYMGGLGMWCLLAVAACKTPTVGSYEVIPLPQEISLAKDGKPFVLNAPVQIVYPEDNQKLKENAGFLAAFIEESTGQKAEISAKQNVKQGIFLEIDPSIPQPEGYRLIVNEQGVKIKASTEAGIFYGIQTLRKALPETSSGEVAAWPAGTVTDYPRFKYRGSLLDVGRHYFPVDYVKQYIDLLALHNINYFHWHLTEDQGWRIEIKKYPKLTEVGSKRKETIIDWETKEYDGKPYGGFYTQDEIKEIVAYATARHITVIPEIDLPGHTLAILASYPELGCTGGPYEVPTTWGVFQDVLCAGNEKSLELVKDVLEEVIELFPSPYIHIGGDECPKARWKNCPKCQAMIRKAGIKADPQHTAENKLQTYFMTQVEEFINSKGRRMIGWDEVLEGGLTPDATIMSWRGMGGGIKAARQHHEVIITPIGYLYLSNPGVLKMKGLQTVKRVYEFEPVPRELNAVEQPFVIGAQISTWTEWIRDSSRLEYVVLPRMAAASEVFWSKPSRKSYDDFLVRLPHMLNIYADRGFEYRQDVLNPDLQIKRCTDPDSVEIRCEVVGDAPVFYTTDGSEPGKQSKPYAFPFKVGKNTTVKAVAIRGEQVSGTDSVVFR